MFLYFVKSAPYCYERTVLLHFLPFTDVDHLKGDSNRRESKSDSSVKLCCTDMAVQARRYQS